MAKIIMGCVTHGCCDDIRMQTKEAAGASQEEVFLYGLCSVPASIFLP